MILVDARWSGEHGIGRYSNEVLSIFDKNPFANFFLGKSAPASVNGITSLSLRCCSSNVSGFYSPGFVAAVNWKLPQLVTVHDLIHLDVASEASGFKNFYYNILRSILKRQRAVITVSHYSAQRMQEWLGPVGPKIYVVYNGVSDRFTCDVEAPSAVFRPYFLYVGNTKPHKNVDKLLQAFQRSGLYREADFRLVCRPDENLLRIVNKLDLQNHTHFHTGVDEEALASLYRGGIATCLISSVEGFGLPVVEAMRCGAQVLVSHCGALREVAGPDAIFVDPSAEESIVSGLNEAFSQWGHDPHPNMKNIEFSKRYAWSETRTNVRRIVDEVFFS